MSTTQPQFSERIQSLQEHADQLEKKLWFKDMCSFGTLAAVAAVPVVVAIFLYVTKFRIIKKRDEDGEVMDSIDKGKFLKWTILLTIIGWIVVYGVSVYLKKKGILK